MTQPRDVFADQADDRQMHFRNWQPNLKNSVSIIFCGVVLLDGQDIGEVLPCMTIFFRLGKLEA